MVQKKDRTQRIDQTQIISSLENIYISPLETCNLSCRYCYTTKTPQSLSNQQILGFVKKYRSYLRSKTYDLKSILMCGGEVFLRPDFPKLVNKLTDLDIFITIITNGTINRLKDIKNPHNCQILVSLDGPKTIHDQNRGQGNFDKSIKYIKQAQKLGFPVGIMFLITKDSYPYRNSFPKSLTKTLKLYSSKALNFTYLTDRRLSLTPNQCLDIKLHYPTFPAKNFGCFQLSLQSTGIITGCCESYLSLGNITDHPSVYVNNFLNSLNTCNSCSLRSTIYDLQSNCHGCCHPNYLCGYPREFNQPDCRHLVKLFNSTNPPSLATAKNTSL
jgi:sulfatase maturation enzyme AslB (radical SAM superfamily)